MKNKKYIRNIYSFWSISYDQVLDKIFKFDRESVIDSLNLFPPEEILELGVGTGLNLPHYPSYVYVTGIDFSEPMLKIAEKKKKSKNIKLQILDIENLNFNNDSFDKVLATFVFRILPSPQIVMLNLQEIVKKEGIIVIVDTFKESKEKLFIDHFTSVLGWGRNINIHELIKGTKWEIISEKSLNQNNSQTRIIKLINKK